MARAPGRVNLIGEHIDYAGLPVLPMALSREMRVLFKPRADALVRATNLDPRFPDETFEVGPDIGRSEAGVWGNYLRAAAQAMAREYGIVRGVDVLVYSDLPASAGLSSSSALVVATALALLGPNAEEPADLATEEGRLGLAEVLAAGERYTGTRGGGMDQAVILLGREGHACRIEFDPLRVDYLPIPPEWVFVVVHSGRAARKSGPEQEAYNRRRREVEAALESGPGTNLPPNLDRRRRHVTSEAVRVEDACRALREANPDAFGRAMVGSHQSLRNDFEVSTPELDEMVDAAMRAGAFGARLTGAGFGGCAVALTRPTAAARVQGAMVDAVALRPGGAGAPPAFLARSGGRASVDRC